MSASAGFTGRHVNHSGRKTLVTSLLNAGCAPTEVVQVTGHKNIMTLNSYHSLSIDRQHQMANMIHKNCSNSANKASSFKEPGPSGDHDDYMTDEEILQLSQEMDPVVEQTLNKINQYENVLDLQVVHSPGGSLSMHHLKNPGQLFSNCTFNGAVNVIFKN
ncbi:hypothetical protein DPMN_161522 [Dreissena polymorpha]|uniref:Tyr recombinase domain-containing protein n=2 Tax=Dreissena polymorpha TaxID=45954 RepID=A0A9D4EP20_DREPO|nr:hypothetical protein DPMN_161522 [Dreissena polymorpha]